MKEYKNRIYPKVVIRSIISKPVNTVVRITIESYALEIAADLEDLMYEYSNGILFTVLQAYYGESDIRTRKAVALLEKQNIVTIHKTVSGAFYLIPVGKEKDMIFPELTQSQRKLVLFILGQLEKYAVNAIITDYSQICRMLDSSYGGLRNRMDKLVKLGYLEITVKPSRGIQKSMVIQRGKKIIGSK